MEYKLIFSNRKTIAIEINENCEVIVRAPRFANKNAIERFVLSKKDWSTQIEGLLYVYFRAKKTRFSICGVRGKKL